MPFYAMVLERWLLPVLLPLLGVAPGCFLFCNRQGYLAAAGFDEALDWKEEVAFVKQLKRQGQFVLLRQHVITSGREVRAYSLFGLLRVGLGLAFSGAGRWNTGMDGENHCHPHDLRFWVLTLGFS